MKKTAILFAAGIFIFLSQTTLRAQNQQQQKEMTFEEMVAKEAERLQKVLNLGDHQLFWVDSILTHDMAAMQTEIEKLRRQGIQEYSSFKVIQDKWIAKKDTAFMKIFSQEQWEKYLKLEKKEKPKKEKRSRKK